MGCDPYPFGGGGQAEGRSNGLWVLWLLLVPILLSGLALLAIRFTHAGQTRRKALLWAPALVLLAFCVVGILSIGLFYLPVALALLVAAVTGSLRGSAYAEPRDAA